MNIIALPILLPLVFMIALLLIKGKVFSQFASIAGSVMLLVLSVFIFGLVLKHEVLVLHMGGWEAPNGISLVVDYLSAIMLVVSSFLVFVISVFSVEFIGKDKEYSKFYFFFFSLILGVNGAFVTGDVFNLYVWFEVMLLSSFVLITMGSKKEQLEGGIKYLALNLVGSLFFLAGLGLLYGKTGTLNMAHLAEIIGNDSQSVFMNTSAMLFFVAFGIKAAIFPLFFWLPASYHTPNITVTALFAGLLTKVGVYAMFRFFSLFFVHDAMFWNNLILVLAGLTMVIGGMAASTYYDTRKILSYHIISQIGYMIMGIGINTPLAYAGVIFFMVHNMIAKTNTFLIAGMIHRLQGTFNLKEAGGLLKQSPWLAVLFIIPAFALAGIPPLSGFFGKFILVKAGIDSGNYAITFVAIATSLLTLYSMIKIWNEAFLKKYPKNEDYQSPEALKVSDWLPSVFLGAASIAMGLFASFCYHITATAAEQLMDTDNYIHHVLNALK